MKKFLSTKLVIVLVGVVIIGAIYLVFNQASTSKTSTNNLAKGTTSITTASQKDGFPSLASLENITNYTSQSSEGNTFNILEHVYNNNDYQYSSSGANVIVDGQKVYSILGNIQSTLTSYPRNKTDQPELILTAEQLNGLFNDPALQVKQTGKCHVAGQTGQQWDLSFSQLSQYAQNYQVCTQIPNGYLLSYQVGAHLGSTSQTFSSQFNIVSIGGLKPYSPSDL